MGKNKSLIIGEILILVMLIVNSVLTYHRLNQAYDVWNLIMFVINIFLVLAFIILIIKLSINSKNG